MRRPNPGRSVDMPTVASHVISKQALSRPSLFSLYSILCIRLRMGWLSPNRLASEVLYEETTVKAACDHELCESAKDRSQSTRRDSNGSYIRQCSRDF